ncbi:general amidase GmdB [Aspergillus brunneoviolaceus CBS 621.78]|uniref:General amidase GmdB n=1 Tax=Aspergillus brunneoviolaceus CBS 621.78 TaxID=1450534 RepID=A0ACD1GD46_9EURO|nr:general amidase GmdB [Aspergillus brunneoviolaceus CBS 621.78]RAH47204.1 general amidase GmdB [Aspergillus brunneoviolaceus CBS 621.78]
MTVTKLSDPEDWCAIVAHKRKQLDSQIPSAWRLTDSFRASLPANGHLLAFDAVAKSNILTSAELDLTENYTAGQLLQRLAWGDVSAVAVTTAFCKRAAVAQQLTSCLTEHFFDRALERARYLDDYLTREGKVVGPLHGLPVSLKDSFRLEGVDTSVGYVSFLGHGPAQENSALVQMLLDLGAVLYVKTNVPQTMMTGDSDNNIYGRTLNPHNTNLTAGGSTGGEGALVALRGSILGVGTDIAGSIRIPALCCGVYGFKPTTARIPFAGQASGAMEGLPGIMPSAGPLAQSFEDLELFMSTILDASPWRYDSTAIAAPWCRPAAINQQQQQLLTIGVLGECAHFPLHPPVKRALENAIDALKKKGHRIVYLNPNNDDNSTTASSPSPSTTLALATNLAHANRLSFQYFIYGPSEDHITPSGEPPVASVAKASSPMFTGPFPVPMDETVSPFTLIDTLHKERQKYSDAWRATFVTNKLDVVLAPGAQSPAVEWDTFGWPPYTLVWNLVDYPACIIPYGKASKVLDPEPMILTDGVQPSYHTDAVDGAPCAIQVVAPRFHDEKCLAAARVIDRDIRL